MTSKPAIIKKLDETVVNRIAAGEVIQRPANALKELIENSLDAKATNVQITVKEGGLKLLQIQDNGTGIRKQDMEIVCERFTTSKLQKFEDLRSIATFGFRGEALASISHVAQLTVTTKTADEKCAYRASYIDGKPKAPPKPCAGNQGTTIMIENLFYNVATRRKALKSHSEEFARITEVVTRYAVHNPTVGFVLKKHGQLVPEVRTPHNSTKISNVRVLFGNPVARELIEVEHTDDTYKFELHGLITNANYSSKRLTLLLFINHRLVDSTPIRKMLEDLYSIYLPKKTHPWCYLSLEINPANVDVNVHPTKHEVRFLHEDSIIEKVKIALDAKLVGNNASRTFYAQARLPKVDITEETLKEVLPEYSEGTMDKDKAKKIYAHQMVRTDSSDQKLEKFNFTVNATTNEGRVSSKFDETRLNPVENSPNSDDTNNSMIDNSEPNITKKGEKVLTELITEGSSKEITVDRPSKLNDSPGNWSTLLDEPDSEIETHEEFLHHLTNKTPSTSTQIAKPENAFRTPDRDEEDVFQMSDEEMEEAEENTDKANNCDDSIANRALKSVYQYLGNRENMDYAKIVMGKTNDRKTANNDVTEKSKNEDNRDVSHEEVEENQSVNEDLQKSKPPVPEFKSYSVNNFRREVKLTSVLKLRKELEDNYHEGLKDILSNMIFVGSVNEVFALIQSGVNLYICNTRKLTEELFYEIMLYDFANYGVISFSESLPLYDLAMLGFETEEAGWTEEDGKKEELANNLKELLLEKADMLKEYFSIVIDKKGNLKSLPILLDKYFPSQAALPLYVLRMATEVDWTAEQSCFQGVCRETAKFYSQLNPKEESCDWKHVTEHILYPAVKDSLLPPKHFAHDSTILQIASLPDLYKVFERC